MALRKTRLSRSQQNTLIEPFVAGTKAQTAARLCALNHKRTVHFYGRLRAIIEFESEATSQRIFGDKIEVRATLAAGKRASTGAELAGKQPYSAF